MILTRQGTLYSWGMNDFGQLGHGDYKQRATPERIDALDGKRVSQIALGHEYVIALGLTMAQKEYERIAKESSGILKPNPSIVSSTTKSKSRRSMSKARSKKYLMQNASDFNQTCFSNSKISFKDTNRDCCSGDRDKLKDVQMQRPVVRKSKSS